METWRLAARKKVFAILFLVTALSASHFTFDGTIYCLGVVNHSHRTFCTAASSSCSRRS